MVEKSLKDKYIEGTNPKELKNKVSKFQEIYYDKETRVMVNKLVNDFYTRLLFKIDALPQDVAFPLEISATFFKNLSTDVSKLLISELVQVSPMPPTENNHQVNQRLLLVRNAAAESENNIRTKEAAVQPASGICHPKTFMGMLAANP